MQNFRPMPNRVLSLDLSEGGGVIVEFILENDEEVGGVSGGCNRFGEGVTEEFERRR